jgi:hypothetical protein
MPFQHYTWGHSQCNKTSKEIKLGLDLKENRQLCLLADYMSACVEDKTEAPKSCRKQ